MESLFAVGIVGVLVNGYVCLLQILLSPHDVTLPNMHLVICNTTFDQRVVHFVFLHSLSSGKHIYEQKLFQIIQSI